LKGHDRGTLRVELAEKLVQAVGRGFISGIKAIESNRALQAAEKLFPTGKKCQGTTSVVPQRQ
jgi:hypothetical protein